MRLKRDQALARRVKKGRYCLRCTGTVDLHAHHIEPLDKGGADTADNICVLCSYCHYEWHREYEGREQFQDFLASVPSSILLYFKKRDLAAPVDDVWLRFRLERVLRASHSGKMPPFGEDAGIFG